MFETYAIVKFGIKTLMIRITKSKYFLPVLFLLFLQISCNDQKQNKTTGKVENDPYYVAAYIWPSCHDEPVSRELLWPEGIGEWEVIKKGTPRFEGHYQPRCPLWGYESDNDPKVMEKWINAATDHGVNVFIFDWYWYNERPFLESCLNDGFLKAANREKMQFYVMWANHDVRKDYWNVHVHKGDTALLFDGKVDWDNFKTVVDRVINQYFHQPNYFKIENCPVFSIYHTNNFIASFGGVDEARKAVDYFRAEVKSAGFPDLHLQFIVGGNPKDETIGLYEKLEANSFTLYNWGGPHREDYLQWACEGMDRIDKWAEASGIPYFTNVGVAWDNTPRFPEMTKKNVVHYNATPQSFASMMQRAKEYCDNHPGQPKIITVFSWNEWVEGGYLLPDVKNGFGYLEAVRDVMNGKCNVY